MKNTGEHSQQLFHDAIKSLGKKAHIHRLADTKSIKHQGKTAFMSATPADFIVGGAMFTPTAFYAEVKSTENKTSFGFDCFTDRQKIAMAELRIAEAGECYQIFVHRLLTDDWYVTNADEIFRQEKKSMRWHDMQGCMWLEQLIRGIK